MSNSECAVSTNRLSGSGHHLLAQQMELLQSLTIHNHLLLVCASFRIEIIQTHIYDFWMEKRVYTLELIVEQNSQLIERLDRSIERLDQSMAKLSQAVSDLRVDMIQGQAALRQDISDVRAELRSEIERKTFWLMTAHYGALLALLGFLGKHFIENYLK